MNDQKTFTLEEENDERKHELIKFIDSGEAILIVGAGSSRRMGYPGWSCLVERLKDLANECGAGFKLDEEKHEDDPLKYLKYVEDIKSHIRDKTDSLGRYHSLLYNSFKLRHPPFDNFHKMLVSLPFRGILTTNYDIVLEKALDKVELASTSDNSLIIDDGSAGRVHEFLRAMTDSSLTRRIAHLHGQFDPPGSIILSIEDYERAYGLKFTANQVQRDSEWTLHRKLLWAVLATRRAVFIGFSMKDPYLNRILDAVSEDLWIWDESTHYVILGLSSDRDEYSKAIELKRKYGIDTVFYPVFDESLDDSHQGLYDIVAEIAEACGVEIPSTVISQEQPDDDDHPIDEKPVPVSNESEDVLDWVKQRNQDMERRMDDEN